MSPLALLSDLRLRTLKELDWKPSRGCAVMTPWRWIGISAKNVIADMPLQTMTERHLFVTENSPLGILIGLCEEQRAQQLAVEPMGMQTVRILTLPHRR